MIDFILEMLESIYSTWLIWYLCRISSICEVSFLNLKIHITIHNKKLAKLLIDQSYKGIRHQMGIIGIVAYLTMTPAIVYFWIKNGDFLLFRTESGITPWFCYYVGLYIVWLGLNVCIGHMLQWLNEQRQEAAKRKCPAITHVVWNEEASDTEKKQAEDVFLNVDKIFWDFESRKLYYKRGNDLLTLNANGEFISLIAEGDSAFVLMLMRTAVCTFSAERKESESDKAIKKFVEEAKKGESIIVDEKK